MPIYKTKLKSREEIAAGTMAFRLEKPEGFGFKAGQFGDYTLLTPCETDAEGNTRGFSLASAPYEADLMFATRMRDTAFKRVLRTMEIGTEITLDAPYGSFTLHNNAKIPSVSQVASALRRSEASCFKLLTIIFPTSFSFSIPTEDRKTRRS